MRQKVIISLLTLILSVSVYGEVVNMANKYCNLNGANKISDEYNKINNGFDAVQLDVESLDAKSDAIDSRVDAIITTPAEGVTAQEIIDARKGETTLRNKIDVIDTQMAENAQDILELETNKVDKVTGKGLSTNDYDNTEKAEVAKVALKADKTYVDTLAASLASGSPSGTYANLAALAAAIPAGNTNVYVTLDDGKWNYWNGSAWVPGGTYQSTGIGVNSVTEEMLTFVPAKGVPSKNLFDKTDVTPDTYLFTDTGLTSPLVGYSTSDYIAVLPETSYALTEIDRICYYDGAKTFISGSVLSHVADVVTTPVGTAFIRVDIFTASADTAQIEVGSELTSYEPFGNVLSPDYITTKMKEQLEATDTVYVQGKNLFDKTKAVVDRYLYPDTGTLGTLEGYSTSSFISVESSTVYSTLLVRSVCFYDASKTFISSEVEPTQVTTPSNCKYIRVDCFTAFVDLLQIESGDASPYEAYGKYLNVNLMPSGVVKSTNNVLIVAKSGGHYDTIMDAVRRAGDSADNPVTILIMPGVYNESVDLRLYGIGRHISLVGVNKHTCIIKNDTGNYYTPPLNLGGNAYIANLTIIATHDNPTEQSGKTFGDPDYLPSYGIHMDDIGEGVNEIYNCVVTSYHNAAIGMGLHNNQTNIINGCELYKLDDSSPYKEQLAFIGALIAHNFQLSGSTNQKLIVKNSYIYSNYGVAMRLVDANHDVGGSADDERDTVFSFYNNVIFSETLKKACVTYTPSPETGCLAGYITLGEDSYGNNIPALNAQ
jgi:hypothetical protein